MNCNTQDEYFIYIRDQVELCMLPTLEEDLDNIQLLHAHFATYHSLLQAALPQLFINLLNPNEDVILNDERKHELRAQLIVFLCELTASPTIYSLKDNSSDLLRFADSILRKLMSKCQQFEESYIFNYYVQKLHKDFWKRQLGAVHGFVTYLEKRFINDVKMSTKMIKFSVAVGLNVYQCYQSEYKKLAIRIFSHMLRHSHSTDIQHMNIHGVIYKHVFRDARSLDPVDETAAKWDCLCLCLDHFTELDGLTWNQCDDMLDRLIQNVSLSSNADMSVCLLNFITKLGYYFALNKDELTTVLDGDFTEPNHMSTCLNVCAALSVTTSYRWAKSILQMLQLESEKLLHNAESCARMLVAMKRCYLVCIVPIPLRILRVHISEFFTKFVAVLLESLSVHKKAQPILLLTQQFTNIFLYQLMNFPIDHQVKSMLEEFIPALDSLSLIISK